MSYTMNTSIQSDSIESAIEKVTETLKSKGFGIITTIDMKTTLKNKIDYTFYSIHMFQRNQNLEELSDSYRLGSIAAGLALARENLWTGVGIGDLKDECNEYFAAHYPALVGQELMPHNQFQCQQEVGVMTEQAQT